MSDRNSLNIRAFQHPIIKARTKDGALAYVGYADLAAKRFSTDLNAMLDAMLAQGFFKIGAYCLTFCDHR